MAQKNNIRSIRFTDELYELIDRQHGDTFTQKLENLVTKCVWELPAKEKDLANIQKRIVEEQQELKNILEKKYSLGGKIREMSYQLDKTTKTLERLNKELSKVHL